VGKIVENRLDIRHCVAEDVKRRVGDSKKKKRRVGKKIWFKRMRIGACDKHVMGPENNHSK